MLSPTLAGAPVRTLLGQSIRRDIPGVGSTQEQWNGWAVVETLLAVVNLPWRRREPESLATLAALAVPLVASGHVPITTFAQAIDASAAEQEWVVGTRLELAARHDLGQAPRLLAQYLVASRAPLGQDLLSAFCDLPEDEQIELFALLQPTTAEGWPRCWQLMVGVSGATRGRLMAHLGPATQEGLGRCREVMRFLPAPHRLASAEHAVRAGVSLRSIEVVMDLGTVLHPIMWRLEQIALHKQSLKDDIAAGMSVDQVDRVHGGFFSILAKNRLDHLFCKLRALPGLRNGRTPEALVSEWGRPITELPAHLRFFAFADDLPGLQAHERARGLPADPAARARADAWIALTGDGAASARDGAPIDELMERYPRAAPQLRAGLEMACILGAAGLTVFSGTTTVEAALAQHQLKLPRARNLLEGVKAIGELFRRRDQGLAKVSHQQVDKRDELLVAHSSELSRLEASLSGVIRSFMSPL